MAKGKQDTGKITLQREMGLGLGLRADIWVFPPYS